MTPQNQIKALAELDGWILEPAGKDSFGVFYAAFWRHQEKPGQHILPSYLTSYDAIVPLVQKQSLATLRIYCEWLLENYGTYGAMIKPTSAQLCEALLRSVGKWKD